MPSTCCSLSMKNRLSRRDLSVYPLLLPLQGVLGASRKFFEKHE